MEGINRGLCTLAVTMALAANIAPAMGACEAKSGNATVPLLELYTSEGCDSCPPADRWLAELPRKGFGADRVVPLAFHVDYWNYLGWIDPFAQSLFTRRQQEFGHRTQATTVYTPEFILNGREYRRWSGNFAADLDRIARDTPRADIQLRLSRSGPALQIQSEASLRDRQTQAELYVALFENNLQTQVRAGENRGRTLQHEFAVRRLLGPFAFDSTGKVRMRDALELGADWKVADLGVAAFAQETRGTAILQALALPVCP